MDSINTIIKEIQLMSTSSITMMKAMIKPNLIMMIPEFCKTSLGNHNYENTT